MKLSPQDADLFFKLKWSLQSYVNLRLDIIPDIATVDEYKKLPTSDQLSVRDALYDNIELFDAYLEENPQELSEKELEIVRSWKKFRRGDFFIERLLKKYAIFIGYEKVYGVLALHKTLDELLPYVRYPHYVQAVLLPFMGKIIYDGILQGYTVSFGGGIKSDLKETYMAAKQNGKIIESFDPKKQAEKTAGKKNPIKDWGPTINEILKEAKKLRSRSGSPAIHSPAFSLAKASIEFARLAVENPDDLDELWKALKKVDRVIQKAEITLHRADY